MRPFQCDLQPQIQETHRTTHTRTTTRCRTHRRNQNDPNRTRRTQEVSFIAGSCHFTLKNARFRAPASSPKHSLCNIHAAITKSPLPKVTSSLRHKFPFVTTSHRHHFPSSLLPIVTTSQRHHTPKDLCRHCKSGASKRLHAIAQIESFINSPTHVGKYEHLLFKPFQDPPQDFESLMAEARLRLKEKVICADCL